MIDSQLLDILDGKEDEVNKDIDYQALFELAQVGNQNVFFDIETAPGEKELLDELFEREDIELPEDPGTFDPDSVKTGNLGAEKAAQKIEQKRQEHRRKVDSYAGEVDRAIAKAWDSFVASAPLSPILGKVGAIGYGVCVDGGVHVCCDVDPKEEELLTRFWALHKLNVRKRNNWVGFNSNVFDIPFITRRSWVLDLGPPYLLTKYNKLPDYCVDMLAKWRMGNLWKNNEKMDVLARAFGSERKLEGMHGGMWWKVNAENPAVAKEYLKKDILSLAGVALRMGI